MSEFKSLKSEEEKKNEEPITNTFGREPIIIDCKYCERKVLSEIENESTWTGALLSVILLLLFQLLSIPLIILIIPLTQQTIHRCPSCLNKIGTCNFYDIFSMSDKILTFTVGSFAVILSRKLLLGFFLFILMIIIVVYFFRGVSIFEPNIIADKWEDFYKFCSANEHRQKAHETRIYCQKYNYADVSWDGYVVRVDFDSSFIAKYKVSMLVKMNKEDKSDDGDMYLKMDDYRYRQMKNTIYSLSRGDHIFFNATITDVGSERHPIFAEPFDLLKLEDFIKINPHIHHHGRYSLDANQYNDEHKLIDKNDTIYSELNEFITETQVNTKLQVESYK